MFKAFLSLSGLTLLSRLSGFVKVAAMAAFYGRSIEADLFMAVMLIPDLLYKFTSEGLVSCAAVPLYSDLGKDKKRLTTAFWTVNNITLFFGILMACVLALFSGQFCKSLFPNLGNYDFQRLRFMWAVSASYIIFALPAANATSLLNSKMIFAAPALGPLIVNAAIIIGIFTAGGKSVELIIYANVVGAFLQLVWLMWLTKRENMIQTNISDITSLDKDLAKVFLSGTAPIGIWIASLALVPVYERFLVSSESQGSLATLNYSEKLFNLPLGIISISLANVILPHLSKLKGNDKRKFLVKSFFAAFLSILPVILFIWFFSDYIVSIVYKRGKFSAEDSKFAADLFRNYSLALLPVSLNMVLNRGFFASKSYLKPFAAGLIGSFSLFLFGNKAVELWGVPGVGYAASLGYAIQGIILLCFTLFEFKSEEK